MQYPPREVCRACLSHRLIWRPQDGAGELLTETVLHTAQELFFRERTALARSASFASMPGSIVVAYRARARRRGAVPRARRGARSTAPARRRWWRCREQGDRRFVGRSKLRELTCDPRSRKVLVTDGKTAARPGDRAGARRGRRRARSGSAKPSRGRSSPGFEALRELPQATFVPLDVTDGRSVRELAGEIGGKVDILINTADRHRTF